MNEEWRAIKGYEGLYEVSNFGNVRSLARKVYRRFSWVMLKGKTLKPANIKGYRKVVLCKNGKSKLCAIHRLVAEAFIPNPSNLPQVNHKDENKANNTVSNLEWCTHSYNMNYGTILDKKISKQGYKIRCVETGEVFQSIREAAKAVNSTHQNISACLRGKTKTAKKYHWELIQGEINNE